MSISKNFKWFTKDRAIISGINDFTYKLKESIYIKIDWICISP